MSEKWRQSEICIVINDKSQGKLSIVKHLRNDDLLNYTFITQSPSKKVLKLVNIWQSYRQNGWLLHAPNSPCNFVLEDADLARSIELLVYYGQKLSLVVVMLIGRLIWVYYQQISNCCRPRPLLTYWLTDWHHQWLTDCWSCRHFAATAFLCCGSCVQWVMGFFLWLM